MKQFLSMIIVFLLLSMVGCNKNNVNDSQKQDYVSLQAKYNDLLIEYNNLKSDYEELENKYKDPDYVPIGSKQWETKMFIEILLSALRVEKLYAGNYITDNLVQLFLVASDTPRNELNYYKELIVDNYDLIKLTCATYDTDYLFLKIIDETTGCEIFELLLDFENDFKLSMSVGMDYIDDLE